MWLSNHFILFAFFCAINFDATFEVFHKIMFPGKTNWYFDPVEDSIINILPEEFFASCAIFIGVVVFVCCVSIFAASLIGYKKSKKQK